MQSCRAALQVEGETSAAMRKQLRAKAADNWASASWQGIGARHFRKLPTANGFMTGKSSLSSSEWTAAIKLNCNYANLRGVKGVTTSSLGDRSLNCDQAGSSQSLH